MLALLIWPKTKDSRFYKKSDVFCDPSNIYCVPIKIHHPLNSIIWKGRDSVRPLGSEELQWAIFAVSPTLCIYVCVCVQHGPKFPLNLVIFNGTVWCDMAEHHAWSGIRKHRWHCLLLIHRNSRSRWVKYYTAGFFENAALDRLRKEWLGGKCSWSSSSHCT